MQHICAVALHDGQMYSIAGGSGVVWRSLTPPLERGQASVASSTCAPAGQSDCRV